MYEVLLRRRYRKHEVRWRAESVLDSVRAAVAEVWMAMMAEETKVVGAGAEEDKVM